MERKELGEDIRAIGEKFEKKFNTLWPLIGMTLEETNYDIPCNNNKHLSDSKKKKKSSHGIDILLKLKNKDEYFYISPKKSSNCNDDNLLTKHYEDMICLRKTLNSNSKINQCLIIMDKKPAESRTPNYKPGEDIQIKIICDKELKWLEIINIRLTEFKKYVGEKKYFFIKPSASDDDISIKYRESCSIFDILNNFYISYTNREKEYQPTYVLMFTRQKLTRRHIMTFIKSFGPILPIQELIIHSDALFSDGIKDIIYELNNSLMNGNYPNIFIRKVIVVEEDINNPRQYPEISQFWRFGPL